MQRKTAEADWAIWCWPGGYGTVENRIGQIRRFFPKKTDLYMVTDGQVKRVERLLNKRPVRKFDYKTPKQVLLEKIALIT